MHFPNGTSFMAFYLLSLTGCPPTLEEVLPMLRNWRMGFAVLCAAALAIMLAPIAPVNANATSHTATAASSAQVPDQAQSVTGTIASVAKNSFTLTLGSAMSQREQTSPRTMMFLIDKNTTVDGKLRVGASADVTYREDNGHNVAINVRIAPAQTSH
jgi:Cu/Ag efflux protein CusF